MYWSVGNLIGRFGSVLQRTVSALHKPIQCVCVCVYIHKADGTKVSPNSQQCSGLHFSVNYEENNDFLRPFLDTIWIQPIGTVRSV